MNYSKEVKEFEAQADTVPHGSKTVYKGLIRCMKQLERLESQINKRRVKGLFPGKPGEPFFIGGVHVL
jgi:hypothetical protein